MEDVVGEVCRAQSANLTWERAQMLDAARASAEHEPRAAWAGKLWPTTAARPAVFSRC